nr:Glycosyl transferase domain containing protein [Haemonchus contortus]
MPTVSILLAKWKWLIVGCLAVYCVVLYWPLSGYIRKENYVGRSIIPRFIRPRIEEKWTTEAFQLRPADLETPSTEQTSNSNRSGEKPKAYKFAPRGRPAFFVEEVLSNSGISLAERLECHANRTAPPKVILSWNAGHNQDNLDGCPEWNCKLTSNRKEMSNADAVLMARQDPTFKRRNDQYIVFFSQESPVNYRFEVPFPDYFNMSLGFRHDTPTSSPYGYTVKLAPSSRPQGEVNIHLFRIHKYLDKVERLG